MPITDVEAEHLRNQVRDLRDTIRWLLGDRILRPWRMVPDSDVDAAVRDLRLLRVAHEVRQARERTE
jgi:hypothetical protein